VDKAKTRAIRQLCGTQSPFIAGPLAIIVKDDTDKQYKL